MVNARRRNRKTKIEVPSILQEERLAGERKTKPVKLGKSDSDQDEQACWRDCICQALCLVREECQSGMFEPFDPLPCGLSYEKLVKGPRKQKASVRFCLGCGVPTKRSDYCSKCANRRAREAADGIDLTI
jgi:hypothetical protein